MAEVRAIVTCDTCGHRQAVERVIRTPEAFHQVCHECEAVMIVEVTAADIAAAAERDRARKAQRAGLSR
jgi:hypothetical protein